MSSLRRLNSAPISRYSSSVTTVQEVGVCVLKGKTTQLTFWYNAFVFIHFTRPFYRVLNWGLTTTLTLGFLGTTFAILTLSGSKGISCQRSSYGGTIISGSLKQETYSSQNQIHSFACIVVSSDTPSMGTLGAGCTGATRLFCFFFGLLLASYPLIWAAITSSCLRMLSLSSASVSFDLRLSKTSCYMKRASLSSGYNASVVSASRSATS